MEKFEYKGETYIIYDNSILDEQYCEVYESLRTEIASEFIKSKRNANIKDVPNIIEFLRINNANEFAIKISLKYIRGYAKIKEIRHFLPIISSLYRLVNKPQKSIELYNEFCVKYGEGARSVALLTSVAAAYLDMNDLVECRHYCNWAYAKERDSKYNNKDHFELANVYARLKKEEEIKR